MVVHHQEKRNSLGLGEKKEQVHLWVVFRRNIRSKEGKCPVVKGKGRIGKMEPNLGSEVGVGK